MTNETNFNLEKSVAEWREQLRKAGLKNASALVELESHLREDFAARIASGKSPLESFRLAVAEVGSAALVRNEFKKLSTQHILPVRIGLALWAFCAIGMAVDMIASKHTALVSFHIFTVTAACFTGFLLGAWGICWVFLAKRDVLSVRRESSLSRAVAQFSTVGFAMMAAGMISGFFVSREYFGVYWQGDAKEIGFLILLAWFTAMVATQRLFQANERFRMMISVAGNLFVSAAWFWAGFGMKATLPMLVLTALHLPLFVMAARSNRNAAST